MFSNMLSVLIREVRFEYLPQNIKTSTTSELKVRIMNAKRNATLKTKQQAWHPHLKRKKLRYLILVAKYTTKRQVTTKVALRHRKLRAL